jgi:hypothetical protein
MEESTDLLLRLYQSARAQLQSIDAGIEEHLKKLLASGSVTSPTARDVAFLEGLRSERDEAGAGLRRAEERLFNHLISQLGLTSDPAK